jgi:hypothetical protein
VIGAFLGAVSDRQLGPGGDGELKFKFASEVDTNPSGYTIHVNFAEGCSLSF